MKLVCTLAALALCAAPASAGPNRRAAPANTAGIAPAVVQPTSPYGECDLAVAAAAKGQKKMPADLLPAIARVESGRLDPATGRVRPWPWTINVDGVGYFFDSKDEVIAAVQGLQAKGKQSIDVGCMQVNLMHHPDAFTDLDAAFDPATNAAYAVRFLQALFAQTNDWPLATAYYHSMTPDLGEQYQRLVFGRVVTPMGGAAAASAAAAAGVLLNTPLAAWPSLANRFAAIPSPSLAFGAVPPKPTSVGGVPAINIGSYPNLLQPMQPGGFGPKK